MVHVKLRLVPLSTSREIYVRGLISLWLFLFATFLFAAQTKRIFLGWVKEIRTMKSYVCAAQGVNM
jgi:hypothetical protein